jgi:phosphatidylglycerophosphate synthase
MFDGVLKRKLDPVSDRIAGLLVSAGLTANAVTIAGFALGMLGAVLVALDRPLVGLALFLAGRIADGLDGAIARRRGISDFGGFLDIVLDFIVYASFVLAFAIRDPAHALAAAVLLASFLTTGTAFLARAIMEAKGGRTSTYAGRKSLYCAAGIAEGFETIVALSLMALAPAWFPVIAYGFAALCVASGIARILQAIPRKAATAPTPDVVLLDSIATAGASETGRLVVTGSHGGRSATQFALSAGVAGLVFNDAGGGREGAGLVALSLFEAIGRPAVAVSHEGARIGEARSTLGDGTVSAVNTVAREAGVEVGMTASEAVDRLSKGRAT